MTWSFDDVQKVTYPRNPLTSTDVEVKFHPIVRIVTRQEDWSLYQDKVRQEFPLYEQNNIRGVTFDPTGNFKVKEDIEHCFSDIHRQNSIYLNQESLRISSKNHIDRDDLIRRFKLATSSLEKVFGYVSPHRLGVRYVNIIDREKISSELQESLQWSDLVSEEFIRTPHEIADTSNTNFMMELRSNLKDRDGELNLRYGLSQNHEVSPDHFRFDLDRYINLQADSKIEEIALLLPGFTQDIYSLFNTVIGEKLKDWMKMKQGDDQNA